MSIYARLLILLAATLAANVHAEGDWNGKKAAVALTYDDALNVHLDIVAPALDKHGLKGTFYVPVGFPAFAERMDDWRQLAADGHELGNHTTYHPCNGQGPDRAWVDPARDLSKWSLQRMVDDIKAANIALQAVDGKTERTFAYPCGDTAAGGESYVESIAAEFVASRGVHSGLESIGNVPLSNIAAFMVNGQPAEQLTQLVDSAIESGSLVVFLFHGVGGEHPLNLSTQSHAQLLQYLDQKKADLWTAPLVDIAKHIKAQAKE